MDTLLQKKIEEAQKQLKDLRVQQQMTADSINQMALEKEDVERQTEEARKVLLDVQFEISEAEKQLQEVKSGVEKIKTDAALVEVELHNKNAKHGEALALLEERLNVISRAVSSNEETGRELDNLIAVKQKTLDQVEENVRKMQAQFSSDKAGWEVTIDGLRRTIGALSEEIIEKKQSLAILDKDIANKKELFAEIDNNTVSRLKELNDAEAKIKASFTQIKDLEEKTKLQEVLVESIETEITALKEELEGLTKEKFNILEQKRALDQREVRIRKAYSDAGVVYPE